MILITGGCGYIGSHTVVELAKSGENQLVIMDNLCNSKREVIDKIKAIVPADIIFYENDICDCAALDKIFTENKIDSVIHFAGLKAVGESVKKPLEYYSNNISGTLRLLEAMKKHGCKKIVFSSSATVYGAKNKAPYTEDMPTSATNPYGWTKVMQEQILRDLCVSDSEMSVALLRYFNPIGAHESGLIGEDPNGIPNNLLPYICKVAMNRLPCLSVYGNDYDTKDGTGVRDYIHVSDLAKGHVKAIEYLSENKGVLTVNLGTGIGYSVLDVVAAYEKASNVTIPRKFAPRRDGDIAVCYADASRAYELLGWKTEKSLDDMCRDSWNFAKKNM